jgi:hypothetical protein
VAYATVQSAGCAELPWGFGQHPKYIHPIYLHHIVPSCLAANGGFNLNARRLRKGLVGAQIQEILQLLSVSGKAVLVDKVYKCYTGLVPCQRSSIR